MSLESLEMFLLLSMQKKNNKVVKYVIFFRVDKYKLISCARKEPISRDSCPFFPADWDILISSF